MPKQAAARNVLHAGCNGMQTGCSPRAVHQRGVAVVRQVSSQQLTFYSPDGANPPVTNVKLDLTSNQVGSSVRCQCDGVGWARGVRPSCAT